MRAGVFCRPFVQHSHSLIPDKARIDFEFINPHSCYFFCCHLKFCTLHGSQFSYEPLLYPISPVEWINQDTAASRPSRENRNGCDAA